MTIISPLYSKSFNQSLNIYAYIDTIIVDSNIQSIAIIFLLTDQDTTL